LQLDSIIVDATFDIYSTANVLVQNVDGLTSTATKNATVAACEDTPTFCLADSCTNKIIGGIECKCMFKGEQINFPTDCMQVKYAERSHAVLRQYR
jgi:hypothetical protein